MNIDLEHVFLRLFSLSDQRIFTQRQQHVCCKACAILLTHRSSLGTTLLTSLVVASAIMRLIMQSSIPGIHDGRRRPGQSVRSHRQPSEKRSILRSTGFSGNFRFRSLSDRCLYRSERCVDFCRQLNRKFLLLTNEIYLYFEQCSRRLRSENEFVCVIIQYVCYLCI